MKLWSIIFLAITASAENVEIEENVDILTKNFFANLQEDPQLKGENFTESSKAFIDKLVADYLDLMKYTLGISKHTVTKRGLPINDMHSLTKDYEGVYMLSGFKELFNIPARYLRDIAMFYYDYDGYMQWYAIALEGDRQKKTNWMVIYKLQKLVFEKLETVTVRNGSKLAVHSREQSVIIIVAEYNPLAINLHEETGVYEFTKHEELRKIQSLNVQYTTDVKIWQSDDNLFLSFAQHMVNASNNIIYEVNMPIYVWLGQHFDIVHTVKIYGAKRIEHFAVGTSNFLAVANHQNNYGNTNIYSEIFKYNLNTEKFVSYQKFLTNAAVDVKHFYFTVNNIQEHFLVFANLFEKDIQGTTNYNTDSIIYKYVEGYFMPFQSFKLNGATEWLPIKGPNKEFLLLVACKFEGVKAFQYNGWKFVESSVQYTTGAFSQGVAAMHSYLFNNSIIVAIANENNDGSKSNIFEVTFYHQNELDKYQENMLNWCKLNIKTVQDILITPIMQNPDKINSEPIVGQSHLSDITPENLVSVETEEVDEDLLHNINEIKEIINLQVKQLETIEKEVQSALHINNTNIIEADVNIENLILNSNSSFFNTLNTISINSIPIDDVINNVIDINNGFIIKDKIHFEDVHIENENLPKIINDQPVTSLLYKSLDNQLRHLIVNGSLHVNNNLKVHGNINGIEFNTKNILLNKGDQSLISLNANTLQIDHLDVDQNRVNFTYLTAKQIFVKGYVNDIDLKTLNKFALRKSGPQLITGAYSFDKLYVDHLFTDEILGKLIPHDLVLINHGNYDIAHTVVLVQDLVANDILVTRSLNGIPALNGTLQVLLSDVPHVQHISGMKTFENLQLQNPITLQGKINSSRLEKMNPVSIIDEDIILDGDYIISGNVTIEQIIKASDIQSDLQPEILSIQRLWNKGLKLTEQQIPVHLQFQQQLHVDQLFADKINDVPVNSFIIMGSAEPQIISGWKTFQTDLNILGSTKVINMNGINLQELDTNILKVSGNQTLAGKHHFQTIIANRVFNINTRFGNHLWEDVITTNTNQKLNGTTIITANSVQVNALQTKTLNSLRIDGYDFNALVNDTVLRGQEKRILGNKEFVALKVRNLQVESLDMDKVPQIIENAKATFQFDTEINLPNNIFIENILFNNHFNGIAYENFGHQWMFSNSEQVIESDQNFEKLIIHGKLFIESGFINDVNVIDLSEHSIKIDEPFHFETVTFSKGLESVQGISLEGTFESLYLNDIVQSNTRVEQIITGKTLFTNNVAIYGDVHFNGLVSGVNITNFCNFAFPKDNYGPYNLHVKGNAYFAKGPVVQYIDIIPIKSILETAWFQNQDIHLTGNFHFDELIFDNELSVDGFIDDIQPQEIVNTYFSKTKDQNITVSLDFDDIVFKSGVHAAEAMVEGTVCGFNLEQFLHTAILDGYDQVFENLVYLDTCQVQELEGEYLVNNLNLETDVMRYDKPNIVTGKKVIENLKVSSMTLDHNIKVQNIDLLWWVQNAVLKKGIFSISGEVIFYNHTNFLNHISSQGFVNRRIFHQDTVLLKSVPQTITGYKSILGNSSFQSVKLKGHLNGFDPSEFLYNQAYKNQNVSFKTPMHFNALIAAPNVNIEKLYQGVNVSKLIHNLTRFATIENYQEHYEKLLEKSAQVKRSLTAQAYFLDYYEVKQVYTSIHTIIPIRFENSTDQYLACILDGHNQNYSIIYQVWDKEKEQFHQAKDIDSVQVFQPLHYIDRIEFQGQERWYIENKNENITTNASRFTGSIYDITKTGLIRIVPELQHNGTKSVSALVLPDKHRSCILLLFSSNAMLYCETQIDQDTSLELYQVLTANNGIEATTSQLQEIVYVFIVNRGTIFSEPTVDVWKYDATTGKFNTQQQIYTTSPNSVTIATYRQTSYLIIASGHLQNAKHAGLLSIYKFNKNTTDFETYQNININAPITVQLVELPTQELILYAVTDNPAEPLVIFTYEGVVGFQEKIIASTLPKTLSIRKFNTLDNRHFVLAKNINNEIRVIEGVFKGSKNV